MELKRLQKKNQRLTDSVLIVLYGIETAFKRYNAFTYLVLIVLYGIETTSGDTHPILLACLNRTLWN